uniref:Calcium homeostasis endoplasmic reticulum protein n=1 Tax=Panagrellus redivivus TaxID=6233 RepID=A0A7E4ZUK3_PANRE
MASFNRPPPPLPSDPLLREIIDRTAESVATNGAGFEQFIATQNANNPQFDFVRGGQYAEYFKFRVAMEQQKVQAAMSAAQPMHHQQLPPKPEVPRIDIETLQKQIDVLKAQVAESENNVEQQRVVLKQLSDEQINAYFVTSQRGKIDKFLSDAKFSVKELDEILATESISGSTISKLKHWIIDNCHDEREREVVFTYLLFRVKTANTDSPLRLLVLFMSDSLAEWCQKRKALFTTTIGRYASKFFAYASENAKESERLTKLYKHWEHKQWFDSKVMSQIKNPQATLTTERNIEIGERSTLIAKLHSQSAVTLAGYEKQHSEFASHCQAQIVALEATVEAEKRRLFLATAADQKPLVPYFNLPAGICLPMVKAEDFNYKPIKVADIRLPNMSASTERLSSQIQRFYSTMPESNLDEFGWEKNGLDAYYAAKNAAKAQFEAVLKEQGKSLEDVYVNRYKSPSPEPELVKPRRTRFDEKPPAAKQGGGSNPFHYVYDDSGSGNAKKRDSPEFEPPVRTGFGGGGGNSAPKL